MKSNDWREQVANRYGRPKVTTEQLLRAVCRTADGCDNYPVNIFQNLPVLDAIRQIIPDPAVQDVRLATLLMGHDYEAKDIAYICAYFRMSKDVESCGAVCLSHREAIADILEER